MQCMCVSLKLFEQYIWLCISVGLLVYLSVCQSISTIPLMKKKYSIIVHICMSAFMCTCVRACVCADMLRLIFLQLLLSFSFFKASPYFDRRSETLRSAGISLYCLSQTRHKATTDEMFAIGNSHVHIIAHTAPCHIWRSIRVCASNAVHVFKLDRTKRRTRYRYRIMLTL